LASHEWHIENDYFNEKRDEFIEKIAIENMMWNQIKRITWFDDDKV
jgi:hypothetical protein